MATRQKAAGRLAYFNQQSLISTGMAQVHQDTLIETAKIHWRDFAPVWAFPIIFLYGGLAPEELGHPFLFFWFVAAPFFFWSLNCAWRPKVRYWHGIFWGMLFPFIIWAVAVFSRIVVIRLLGEA